MTPTEKIIAIAKLDGWKDNGAGYYHKDKEVRSLAGDPIDSDQHYEAVEALPNYLNSRDAIVPVIDKHFTNHTFENDFFDALDKSDPDGFVNKSYLFATPLQLSDALLRATGKWKD